MQLSISPLAPIYSLNYQQNQQRTACRRLKRTWTPLKEGVSWDLCAIQSRKEEPTETSTSSAEFESTSTGQQHKEEEALSEPEIRELAKVKRQLAKEDNLGLLEGVWEETRLISWPSPMQALRDTFTVVAIVAVSAVLLFAMNTGLTEGSKALYSALGK